MRESARTPRLTYRDYLLIPEDGMRHEILEGEEIVSPSPVPRHQIVLVNLTLAFGEFIKGKDLGRLLVAPMDVVLADDTVLEPDILFIAKHRLGIIGEKAITGAPDLVVEVVSPSSRKVDRREKLRTYQKHGVREYWIADPDARSVEVFVLKEGRLAPVAAASLAADSAARASSPAVLPGFAVQLADLFS